jgi:ABC-type antimicrobial peptide transport system permease subunit
VVGDIRGASLERPPQPEIYYTIAQNFAQQRSLGLTMVVRGRVGAQTLAGAFREVNPNQAIFRVSTMEDVIDDSLADQRLYLWLLAVFAILGTALAAAGIYSVIAYLVTLRAREFGIRMALGADAPRILRLVAGRGAALVSAGLVLGVAGAAALMRVLKNALFGVTATDPATFAAMAALLGAVAMAACIVPARRASQVNPSDALRSE